MLKTIFVRPCTLAVTRIRTLYVNDDRAPRGPVLYVLRRRCERFFIIFRCARCLNPYDYGRTDVIDMIMIIINIIIIMMIIKVSVYRPDLPAIVKVGVYRPDLVGLVRLVWLVWLEGISLVRFVG